MILVLSRVEALKNNYYVLFWTNHLLPQKTMSRPELQAPPEIVRTQSFVWKRKTDLPNYKYYGDTEAKKYTQKSVSLIF